MAIQISRLKSIYQYKISDTDPTVILVRLNKANVRWRKYGSPFSSPESARDALFLLEKVTTGGSVKR